MPGALLIPSRIGTDCPGWIFGGFQDPPGKSPEVPGLTSWLTLPWVGGWTREFLTSLLTSYPTVMNYDFSCAELCFNSLCMCNCGLRKLQKGKELARVTFSLFFTLLGQSTEKHKRMRIYKVTYSHMALYNSENKINVNKATTKCLSNANS